MEVPRFHHRSRFKMEAGEAMGRMIAAQPTTASRLKILEPMMLPRDIPLLPFIPAVMLTAASGALVPMETRVRPMMIEGIFSNLAIEEEPSTKKSAPLISKTKPISKSK